MNANLVDQVTTYQVDALRMQREASSQQELQGKLHSIYEQKLADAVEEERQKMHQEFTDQLEEQLQLIKEQSD